MKRLRVELAELAARDNLALACWKAARGKGQRPAVAAYLAAIDERLAWLAQAVLAGEAPLGIAHRFVIHDPKRREITAACFADRVLHHAILNLVEPRFEQALAPSAYACRPGRGVHAAVQAVQRGLQRWPWALQVDVAGYFTSIDHALLMQRLARLFKGDPFLALLQRILAAGAVTPGRGLPIGALTSQHFANHFLGSADRLLEALPGVRGQVRYMDDMVWFCDSLDAAHDSLAILRLHVEADLRLRLKPAAVLQPSRRGLAFCGFRVRQGVVLASGRKLRRARQHARRLLTAERDGACASHLQRAAEAHRAALLPAQTLHFRRSLWWPDMATDL